MAKKIFKGVGKVLGIGKKKKPAETVAAPAEQKGPIVTPLGGAQVADAMRRRGRRAPVGQPTILSDKLGA